MTDVVGERANVGVIIPSTNTVVEHDFWSVGVRGVTYHAGRIYIDEGSLDSDDAFEALLDQVHDRIGDAIRNVMTTAPDHLVMGMSAETFWGGVEGNREFEADLRDRTGLEVTTGATATREALELFDAERVAFVTPYQPVGDEHVRTFYREAGFEVADVEGLRCPSATAIAAVTERELVDALRRVDGPDVDAIVQVGTNLSMLELADEAERWLDKPVVAINAATLWHALRAIGIDDRFDGFGTLLREH
jgi:maleate isomerase